MYPYDENNNSTNTPETGSERPAEDGSYRIVKPDAERESCYRDASYTPQGEASFDGYYVPGGRGPKPPEPEKKPHKRGMGAALANMGAEGMEGEEVQLGAMLVSPQVANLNSEGGVAEKAGAATAVAVDKVHTTVDKAKPVVSKAAAATGEAVNKGAYATGKQIAATKGMFSGFKEEYDKARGVKPGSDDQALAVTDEAEDEGVSAPAKPASTAPKKKTTAKKPAPKKNMFAAFKEEYDKARHDD